MSEVFSLKVEARDPAKNKGTGTRVARRLRAQGRIPAIVYGHKQVPQPISLARDDVWQLIKRAARLAELRTDGQAEMVLVRDIQWDHLGKEVLHLDFARVSADEQVHTEVELEFHGTPAGVGEGGILEIIVHSLPITCRAVAIPDAIRVELTDVHLNQGVYARDLKLPEGVTTDADPELLLAHVVSRAVATEEAAPAAEGPAEPEVIGRKAGEGEEKDTKDTKEKK